MAQSYIPEGTMVVCTEMKSPMDNAVVRYRDTADVFQKSKKVNLLNDKDLKLQFAFVCNINSKFWGGLGTLCAVVAIGALVIGTVLTGGLLLAAVGVAAVAVTTSSYAAYKEISHDCDFTTTSKWINTHSSVNINENKALLQNSKLMCTKGGALSLVVDPVLARAAGAKIAANNTKEYNAHVASQGIQGVLLVISAGGDPRQLAIGLPLTVWHYNSGENEKQETRNDEIEDRIANADVESGRKTVGKAMGESALQGVGDEAIGAAATAVMDNVNVIRNIPAMLVASLSSQYPAAAVRLNSTILFRGFGTNSFKWSGAAKGFGWGMAGAAVDVGSDVYENSLYDDTLDYFRKLSKDNKLSEGINIIANK